MTGVDVIGVLFDPPAVEDGPPVALDGWHVNITPDVLAARPDLELFVVAPAAMRRVWAGDSPTAPTLTVALRFADEAEGLDYFPAD